MASSLPPGKRRAARLAKRKLPATAAGFEALVEAQRAHPDEIARTRLWGLLNEAAIHPDVRGSETASTFVWVMLELLTDMAPGETVDEVFEPLRTVLANHGGGRPRTIDHDEVARNVAEEELQLYGERDAKKKVADKHGVSARQVHNIVKKPSAKLKR